MQASKAARVAIACQGRSFVDFSARRDHGVDAAVGAARAALLTGASATSLVDAGRRFGAALSGTMAHAFVMAFDDECDAFLRFARTFPGNAVLLLDTWDTVQGAHRAVDVARELRGEGIALSGVRIDSGDLGVLARKVRSILDEGGFPDVRILASGDLDEYVIAALIADGAPIDGFGVGTRMGTSEDAPSVGIVYKLVADDRGPKLKLSEGKATLPGRKQVLRMAEYDVLCLDNERLEGRTLLAPVVVSGARLTAAPTLTEMQERCASAIGALPPRLRSLEPAAPPYEVRMSTRLQDLVEDLTAVHRVG
jgi:nicotinate phosphoribosyltransferase